MRFCRFRRLFFPFAFLGALVALAGCKSQPSNRVVLYCSVDDVYAKPVVAELERKTGLQIDVLYDVESAKTAGLANRIRAEKERPRADVFWSSALLQTLLLQREGLLQEYSAPNAKNIPLAFKDSKGAWTGVGLRARVLMFPDGKNRSALLPQGLLQPQLKNKIGISNPQFGTASDWAAALTVRWGKAKTLEYFRALKKNGVRVLPGNGVVAEYVARGDLLAGVTDSDDFYAATRNLKPSQNRFLMTPFATSKNSSVLVPGSVAILKGAPHNANAQKLVDAILDPQTETRLKQAMLGVEPLHNSKQQAPDDTAKWAAAWDEIREPLAQILLSD
jgi:iron(III) transport system substrate-binding protein